MGNKFRERSKTRVMPDRDIYLYHFDTPNGEMFTIEGEAKTGVVLDAEEMAAIMQTYQLLRANINTAPS